MITYLTEKDIPQIVDLHFQVFPRDFLTELGRAFLEQSFYPLFITSSDGIGFVYEEEEQILGYVVGSINSGHFYRSLLRNNIALILQGVVMGCLRKPYFLVQVWKTVFVMLGGGASQPFSAELSYIAVAPRVRGKKIAYRLCDKLIHALVRKGVDGCWTKTRKDNKISNKLYTGLGFKKYQEYVYNDAIWIVYGVKF